MSPPQPRRTKGGVAPIVDTVHADEHRARQLALPWPFSRDLDADHQERNAQPLPAIFTIGHSNLDTETFLALLRQHELATLVDVRSAPYSRYAPHFNRGALNALLHDEGIRYVWAGTTLGGRPHDPACYRDGVVRKGNIDYRAMARQGWYRDGVRQLLENAADAPTVVMCSEEDPRRCHRHHLIEQTLRERGVCVLHIRRDGILETIDASEVVPAESPIAQLALHWHEKGIGA